MLKLVLGASLLAAILSGCEKDKKDGGDDQGVSVPRANRVIPESFKNDRDEAGFKAKLPETSAVLKDSTTSLSLGNPSPKSSLKKLNLTRGLLLGFAKRLDIPNGARQELAGVVSGPRMLGTSIQEDEGDVSDLEITEQMFSEVEGLEIGSDCTMLLNQLSGQYDQAVASYSKGVEQIGETDFSSVKAFTVDGADPSKEAFAYKVYWSSEDAAAESDIKMEDGKANFNGRFSGGANDHAVALTANGVLAFASADSAGNVGADLNTFADMSAKELKLGVGVGFDVSGKDDEGNAVQGQGQVSLTTSMSGGATPGQSIDLQGNFSDGKNSASGKVVMALKRESYTKMTLDVDAAVKTPDGEKNFTRKVLMAISKSDFAYETCAVASVSAVDKQ